MRGVETYMIDKSKPTWKPDTCQCVIEFSEMGNDANKFVKFQVRCNLHETSDVNDVLSHNISYNHSVFKNKDLKDADLKTIDDNKKTEKERIKKLKD